MEFLHYQKYLDKLFCNGNLWKHRTFRTVLDCGSTEWNQTSIEKKIEFIQKITEQDNLFHSFGAIVSEYRIYYLEGKKQHVINNLEETLEILYNSALKLDDDKGINIHIYDALDAIKIKSKLNVFTTKYPFADLYLNNIEEYPFFMILAIAMECRGFSNYKSNAIPFIVHEECVSTAEKIKRMSFQNYINISQETLKDLFDKNKLHIYNEEYALRFYHTIQYIHNHLDDDVSHLWIHATTKEEIVSNILELPYMYIDKAEKIFILLNYCFRITSINENNMNTPTQQFLFRSYFGNIEDKTNAAINRAYRKAIMISECNIFESKFRKNANGENILFAFLQEIKLSQINSYENFDAIHKKYCEKITEISELYLTIGQAQLWLNMTLKHLIILEDDIIIKYKKYFHIPVDDIIQDEIEREFGIKGNFNGWFNIREYSPYLQYQNDIRNMLQNTFPIDMEMVYFNDALNEIYTERRLNNIGQRMIFKVNRWMEQDGIIIE
ncbi:MAG: hypothetical protein IPN93_16540 [Bacteroidetes bacterium]|nr:hypothetical protein [Bacteroidota bacterium]